MSELTRLRQLTERLAERVHTLEQRVLPLEQGKMYHPPRLMLGRIIEEHSGDGFDRFYTVEEQGYDSPPSGQKQVDSGFKHDVVHYTDRDALPQSYSHDVLVLELTSQLRVMVPTPMRIVPVRIETTGSSPTAKFADVTGDGATSGFGSALPVWNVHAETDYVNNISPLEAGRIHPGFRAWPLPDEPLTGIDADDGFFIIFATPPPTTTVAKTVTKSDNITISDGDTIKTEVDVDLDSQGNVLDVRITKSKV